MDDVVAPDWAACRAIIDDADVVSFDFFDTLATRLAAAPDSVQCFVGHRLETGDPALSGFFARRKSAEQAARLGRPDLGDVDMDMIYAEFGRGPPWSGAGATLARRLEIEIDQSFVVPRGRVVDLLSHAKQRGKRTIVVSDSYFPIDFIEQAIEKFGWSGLVDDIYISSAHYARKDNGALWDLVVEREGLAERRFVHFGDNPHSDIASGRARGLRCVLLTNTAALAVERGLDHAPGEDWRADILLGPAFARLGADPFEAPLIAEGRELGYCVYGPIFLAFFAWLLARPDLGGLKRLYFAGREGYFLQRLVDDLVSQFGFQGLPPTRYLPISRRAVIMAGQAVAFDPARIMDGADFTGGVEDLLSARLGMTLERADLFALTVRLPEDRSYVDEILRILEPVIVSRAQRERSALLAYAEQCGLMDDGPMGLVDIGYSATIQAGLQAVTGRPLSGFYMATTARAKAVQTASGVAFGCFKDGLRGDPPDDDFMASTVLLEALLTAPHGQLSHFRQDPTGAAAPVFAAPGKAQEQFAELESIFEGALAYARDLIGTIGPEVLQAVLPARLKAFAVLDAVRTGRIPVSDRLKEVLYLEDGFCGNGEVPGLKPR